MADQMTLLRTFVAMVDQGSLIGAARAQRRSPPAISRSLADLEDLVGVNLVERTTRRFKPTDAGFRLAERARLILADFDDALSEAAGLAHAPRGLVRVTAPLTFGREHVSPLVTSILDTHPQIVIDLQLADRIVDLHDENFDLGVRIGAVADASLIRFVLGEVRLVTVASSSYLEHRGAPLSPAELLSHDIIQHTSLGASEPWWFQTADGRSEKVAVKARFAINQADAAIAAARAGRGLVRALSYQVAEDIRLGRLRPVLESFEPPPMPVNLVWPEARRSLSRVSLVINHLKTLKALDVLQPG